MDTLIVGISSGAAYALMAVGVVLIFKCTRALSIAQGEIGAFGFFVGLRWAARGIPGLRWHIPVFATLLVAVVIGVAIALLLERLVMRPLVRRPPLDGLIATLGIALFLALAELRLFGTATQLAPSPVGSWKIVLFGATLGAPRVIALLIAAAVAGGLYAFFKRSKFGLAVLATASDPTVARVLGVPVNQVYRFAWVVGGALSGVAAALLAPAFGGLTPFGQTTFALRALSGAVIGGLDSVWGAIAGSLFVGVLEAEVGAQISVNAKSVAVFAAVLLTLLVRPRGLFGEVAAA
ncbi:MAG TPA: branched-chain amino acid ABC transporter permease [Acidimicrobiales bacterium]|nr:branched-chain amino acid ABC transporter permease [Acidimicrobiales bacterium]